jgi:hypothetical protein
VTERVGDRKGARGERVTECEGNLCDLCFSVFTVSPFFDSQDSFGPLISNFVRKDEKTFVRSLEFAPKTKNFVMFQIWNECFFRTSGHVLWCEVLRVKYDH